MRPILEALQRFWQYDWRHVPPPNWACSRRRTGGLYW
jgi:hypothetical protein